MFSFFKCTPCTICTVQQVVQNVQCTFKNVLYNIGIYKYIYIKRMCAVPVNVYDGNFRFSLSPISQSSELIVIQF